MQILCTVRTAKERTESLVVQQAQKLFDNTWVISESPFFKAVVETFKVGSQFSEVPLLLALDADVLLDEQARIELEKEWIRLSSTNPRLFRADFLVKDKFRGRVYAGCHLYANQYSAAVTAYLSLLKYDPTQKRPESTNIRSFVKKSNLASVETKIIVGKHDHEQYYRHVYIKYYNRAVRDRDSFAKIYDMIRTKAQNNPEDKDYIIALLGMEAAQKANFATMCTDAAQYPDITSLLESLDLKEKDPLYV